MSTAPDIHGSQTGDEDALVSNAGVPVTTITGIERYQPKRELGFAKGTFQMRDLEEFNAPVDAGFDGEIPHP